MSGEKWRLLSLEILRRWESLVTEKERERESEKRGRRTPTDRGTRINQRNAGVLVRRIAPSILR
jgi:hypothetical protein